ncbi:MAG: ATP-binding protein [Pirellulales bacterium]
METYRGQVASRDEESDALLETDFEIATAKSIHDRLHAIQLRTADAAWSRDYVTIHDVRSQLDALQFEAENLPGHLHSQLASLAKNVRSEYHVLIGINGMTTAAAITLLAAFLYLFYRWVFHPLTVLVAGTRQIAAGDFAHRIALRSHDEMAELAAGLNDMTARFREIRDDLDRQVQERTKQVVRNEQLASVGFLAAGVAHEINNPLASIAMCAESLEGRLGELQHGTADDVEVAQRYLGMIQSEAFRCKEITEKLLDFSRLGNAVRQETDLGALLGSVLGMVGHLDKYRDRKIEYAPPAAPLRAVVVAPEIKQVVLNLVTNALDCMEAGGTLRIAANRAGEHAELLFVDDGCGMTSETLQHLFEPFFTRKRQGQGTGLGLSISYRIISDHGGHIVAHSDGPGRGARFAVTLPLRPAVEKPATAGKSNHVPSSPAAQGRGDSQKEPNHGRRQAA